MQIVIDINEKLYYRIKNYEVKVVDNIPMASAINDGIPLPKGHGRLGDLDALETEIVSGIRAGNYEEGYENYGHINDMDDCLETVRFAETIIEADKGE